MKLLVTGGTGLLGSRLVPRLAAAGHQVRVMTHSGRKVVGAGSIAGDLLTGQGVTEAVSGAECVIHLATSPHEDSTKVDVLGTKGLIEMARRAQVAHLIYVSIVGVDKIPYPYYKAKLQAEKQVQAAQVPWTIIRATQFFSFVDRLLKQAASRPVLVVPKGWKAQPVDAGEVSGKILESVLAGPREYLPDFGGPEVYTSEGLAAAWQAAHANHRPLLAVPWPTRLGRAFQKGLATCPDNRYGRITFTQWMAGARG
ncbi:MAG: NAD(P)H-binding protein [Chloroflexota bacterium]